MSSMLHRPLYGIALITAGSLFGAISDALTKLLTARFSVAQVMFWQSTVVLVAVLAFAAHVGMYRIFRSVNWSAQLARGLLQVATSFLLVSGLAVLPFSTVVTLWFANPLLTAALAPFVLGERSNWRKWSLVAMGFGGVAVIAGPLDGTISILMAYPLGAALCGAVRDILTRTMSASESSESMIFYSTMIVVVASGVAVGGNVGFGKATASDLVLFGASGIVYLLAIYLIAEAFRHAKASAVAPFKYTTIIWAAALDIVLWNNVPTWNVLLGSFTIVIAMYSLYRVEK